MDPLTHVVVGRAVVAAAAPDRDLPIRGVAAASILGALAPDIDSVLVFRGWDIYLRAHEAWTHSIPGALPLAAAAAALVRMTMRRSRYGPLLGAAAAGTMSHIILDVASGAHIAVAWPLSSARAAAPLVAMADPWLIGCCVVALAAIYLARQPRRTVARALLVTMGAFLAVKAALLGVALVHTGHGDAAARLVEAKWGSLTRWTVFERAADMLVVEPIALRGRVSTDSTPRIIGPETPLVHASRALPTVQNFLAVHTLGFAVEQRRDDGTTEVLWSDIRYCERQICGLWFGGEFDASGRAIRQVVKVGDVLQTRPVPR